MASVTEILHALNYNHIYIDGVGELVIHKESICVGNNAVIARCHIVGAEDDGDKLLRCYIRWRSPIQSKYDHTFIPKAFTITTLMGESQEVDVSLSDWYKGITLGQYLENDSGGYDKLSHSVDALVKAVLDLPYAHGDIQTDNILILEDGSMQLIDYDIIWETKFIEDIHEGHFDVAPDNIHIARVNRQRDAAAIGYLSVMIATMAHIERLNRKGYRELNHRDFMPDLNSDNITADLKRALTVLGNCGDSTHYQLAQIIIDNRQDICALINAKIKRIL